MRQWNLLRLREELARQGITPGTFAASCEEITRLLRRTHYQPIQGAIVDGMRVFGVRLNRFRGFLRWQTQTNTYFSQEISDRVRVVACLTTLPNIIHSDSPGDTLASSEWQMVKKALNARDEDTLVIVWGPEVDARLGAEEVIIRAREATVGVPSETRQALADGTNGFERILPGPDRMYPDTDLPPKRIPAERLEGIKTALQPSILARERWYHELGVPEDVVEVLSVSPLAPLFEKLVKELHIAPELAAVVLVQFPKRLKKKKLPAHLLKTHDFEIVFEAFREGRLHREGILPYLEALLTAGKQAQELLPPRPEAREIEATIEAILTRVSNNQFPDEQSRERMAMGLFMKKWRGQVEGAEAARTIRNQLKRISQ
jgi:glutamyl-tRNA(Gln) amidotransferase subunit E